MKINFSARIAKLGFCVPAAAWILAQSALASEPPTLTFGIVPQQAPSRLLQNWGPVLRHLQQRTGYRFAFRTAPDIPTFEQRLRSMEYDFAYMNPFHFAVFNSGDEGYQALVREDKKIRGILVVRKDSPLKSLDQLAGMALAFPAPAAFAASVLPRAHLGAEGVDFEPRYVSSHDSVYLAVARGLFSAGGGVMRTFGATDPKVREQLRLLWTTPGYTPHAIAVCPWIAKEVRENVRRGLIEMVSSEAGRAALAGLNVKSFTAAFNADWDDVRELNIDTRLGGGR